MLQAMVRRIKRLAKAIPERVFSDPSEVMDWLDQKPGFCNGGYVRSFDHACVCGARGTEVCRARFHNGTPQ